MSFLTLNGLEVAVADQGSTDLQRETIEPSDRMFDGSLSRRRIVEKRSWKFTTIPLPADRASILEALLRGRGEGWSFDRDAWSARPLPPNTAANTFTNYRLSGPADGRAGFLEYNPSAYGKGIEHGPITTNILAANQRSVETGTAGFNAVDGATLLQSPDYFYHGTKSLRVLTSATVNGIRGGVNTTGVAAASGGSHAGSCYLFATSAVTIRAYLYNATTATAGPISTITLVPYEWRRVRGLTLAGVVAGNLLQLWIEESVADSGIEFFVDALQIELSTLSTPFVDGVRATASRTEYQGLDLYPFKGFTISFWTSQAGAAGGRYAVTLRASATSGDLFQIGHSGSSLSVSTVGVGGLFVQNIAGVFSSWAGRWIQIVVDCVARTVLVYVNGALVGTVSIPVSLFPAFPLPWVYLGAFGGGLQWLYPIDDLVILPWAADVTQLANIRAATRSIAVSPRLWAEGSFLPEGGGILCDAQLADSAFASYASRTNSRRVSFTLEEV